MVQYIEALVSYGVIMTSSPSSSSKLLCYIRVTAPPFCTKNSWSLCLIYCFDFSGSAKSTHRVGRIPFLGMVSVCV